MSKDIFSGPTDYWRIAENNRNLYMSHGALLTLLDFERVLDDMDVYAFRNWELGELIKGPEIERYRVSCIFMWPEKKMPDPRAGKRLIPFDCEVNYKKTTIQIPVKVDDPGDYRPGTRKPKLVDETVWLVEISMPRELMTDIRTGSIELADQTIDLEELDSAYEEDLDQQEYNDTIEDELASSEEQNAS